MSKNLQQLRALFTKTGFLVTLFDFASTGHFNYNLKDIETF